MNDQNTQTRAHLNNRHKDVLISIFAHPTSHNVRWVDVLSLLEALGSVEEKHDGKLRVCLGSKVQVFDKPKSKDIDTQDLIDLRTMLRSAGFSSFDSRNSHKKSTNTYAVPPASRAVVALDFHRARIYLLGEAKAETLASAPAWRLHHDLYHRHHSAENQVNFDSDVKEFFDTVIQVLFGTDEVLLLGHGTGKANASSVFTTYFLKTYPNSTMRIVASAIVDLENITDNQLFELGKTYFESE